MKTILFIDNTAHHLYGQLHNISAMYSAGHKVILLIPNDSHYFKKLSELGYICIDTISSWKGQNVFYQIRLLYRLKRIIYKIKPDIICSFTIKPNLYTAIVNGKQSIQIANVTGLGYAFMGNKVKRFIFSWIYKFAFRNVSYIFFQNNDDYTYFKKFGILSNLSSVKVLPGSGVDLKNFNYVGISESDKVTFLYSGRLLADKGVYELIYAMRKLKQIFSNISLVMIGNFFPDNPSAISKSEVDAWVQEGVIQYMGMVDNVVDVMIPIHCVVLPSYREGMPRCLLEASSMGKPIITVDSVGCKEVVEDGVTGLLAKVRDSDSLFQAMYKFMQIPYDKKVEMGIAGRKKIEKSFDQRMVVKEYIDIINFSINSWN